MTFEQQHPAEQLLLLMDRIYHYGMTTTSGGNLSIKDENGDIWITPSGVDKGALTCEDIVCVKNDGSVEGKHRPSSEFPFHRLIYEKRPDLRGIVHAHPPALVSFSIVRKVPDTRLLPNERQICGEIGIAPYALPGSEQLGENIANVFAQGFNSVLLENHGIVIGAANLLRAFHIFESLDYCARLEIKARQAGEPTLLTDEDYETVRNKSELQLTVFQPEPYTSAERQLREQLCQFVHRSYDQGLFHSTQGTLSQRLSEDEFIITPYGIDRKYLQPEHLVKMKDGKCEAGKNPSKSVWLHREIYKKHDHIDSIMIAHPPNIMAFAVTDIPFDSRTIPESYILLRGMPKIPFESVYNNQEQTAEMFMPDTPIVIVKNNCVIVTGQGMLNTFDRLEVAEYSAKSILAARTLGPIVHIDDDKINDLKIAFQLD